MLGATKEANPPVIEVYFDFAAFSGLDLFPNTVPHQNRRFPFSRCADRHFEFCRQDANGLEQIVIDARHAFEQGVILRIRKYKRRDAFLSDDCTTAVLDDVDVGFALSF